MVQNTKETLLLVGGASAIAAIAIGMIGSGIISGAQTESLEIVESSIKKAGNSAVLTVGVKNDGTSVINNVLVTVNDVTLTQGTGPTISSTDFGKDPPARTAGTAVTVPGLNGTCSSCVLTFLEASNSVNAGQTIYYTGTMPGTNAEVVTGGSYVVTVTGEIGDGISATAISASGVVTVTGF